MPECTVICLSTYRKSREANKEAKAKTSLCEEIKKVIDSFKQMAAHYEEAQRKHSH